MGPPSRGEVWLADLDPVRGHEQAGRRPVLVVSVDPYNFCAAGLCVVVPITSNLRPNAYHVRLEPPDGGLRKPSKVLCDAVRSGLVRTPGRTLGHGLTADDAGHRATLARRPRVVVSRSAEDWPAAGPMTGFQTVS